MKLNRAVEHGDNLENAKQDAQKGRPARSQAGRNQRRTLKGTL